MFYFLYPFCEAKFLVCSGQLFMYMHIYIILHIYRILVVDIAGGKEADDV